MSLKKLKAAVTAAQKKHDEAKELLDMAKQSSSADEKQKYGLEYSTAATELKNASLAVTKFNDDAEKAKAAKKTKPNAGASDNEGSQDKNSKPKTDEKKSAAGGVKITSRIPNFRRCGMAHPANEVVHEEGVFTNEQIEIMDADPDLVVVKL